MLALRLLQSSLSLSFTNCFVSRINRTDLLSENTGPFSVGKQNCNRITTSKQQQRLGRQPLPKCFIYNEAAGIDLAHSIWSTSGDIFLIWDIFDFLLNINRLPRIVCPSRVGSMSNYRGKWSRCTLIWTVIIAKKRCVRALHRRQLSAVVDCRPGNWLHKSSCPLPKRLSQRKSKTHILENDVYVFTRKELYLYKGRHCSTSRTNLRQIVAVW